MLDRHRRFVEEYMVDGNGAQAYIRAYEIPNHKSAKESASRLLRNPEVIAELDRLQKERMERVMWTAEEILEEIKNIAHDDESTRNEKLKALELAAKSLGMFRDKIEHSGGISITLDKDIEEWAE